MSFNYIRFQQVDLKEKATQARCFITSELVINEQWGWFWKYIGGGGACQVTSSIPPALTTVTWNNKEKKNSLAADEAADDGIQAQAQHVTVSEMCRSWHLRVG